MMHMRSGHSYTLAAALLFLFAATTGHAAERKFHGGHYVAITERESISSISHLDEPAVRGVNKRYYWSELEPQKDQYDFASIRSDLKYATAHHKQLVVFITDKTFQPNHNPLPQYLAQYALPNLRGYTAKRWDPVVVARIIALSQALAKEFDNNPAFEGIAFQESALMLSPSTLNRNGYTPEKYRDALIQILSAASRSFSQSQVFWYMNHLEQNSAYLADVAEALAPGKIVMGGPDILPYRKRLQPAYQLYDKFNGRLKLFCSAQDDSYRHDKNDSHNMGNAGGNLAAPPGGYVPMEEIFQFAREKLHVNYIFWSFKEYRGSPGAFTYEDAIDVMQKHPAF
ncbi:MAG: hypothetical protein ACXWKG_09300 [Limisphaerales bacterium]